MKERLLNTIEQLVGRRAMWRLGRALYSHAKADFSNNYQTNGERFIQQQVLNLAGSSRDKIVIFDVGANVGEWTTSLLDLALAQQCSNIEVHAFEPIPATFELLSHSISKHQLGGQVKLIQAALSSEDGPSKMYTFSNTGGTNSLHFEPMLEDRKVNTVLVEKMTALRYCDQEGIDRVDLFKCDAEGHDAEVLFGAGGLLKQERVTVFQFEYNHRWVFARHFLKDIFDFSRNLPYVLGKITPTHIELYDEWHPELEKYFEGNYVLIHRNFIDSFTHKNGKFDARNTYA